MADRIVYKILTSAEHEIFERTGSFSGSRPIWRTGSSIFPPGHRFPVRWTGISAGRAT